jgi:hypothetical protein
MAMGTLLPRIALGALWVVAAAGAPAAQGTVVSPAHFARAEGRTQNRFPLGELQNQAFRYLQVHDDLQGTARVVRGLSFRRVGATDLLPRFQAVYPPYTVTLDAWCSTAATTSTTLSATFDANHGTDRARVVTNRTFNFPASEPGWMPQAFAYALPFDAPFSFQGGGPFCWEVQVADHTNTIEVYHDAVSGGAEPDPPFGFAVFGQGCTLPGRGAAMTAAPEGTLFWPRFFGNLFVRGSNGPPNSTVFLLLGFRRESWAGLPLPYLLPGSETAPSGPCHLYTSVEVVVSTSTDATGFARAHLQVPASPDLNGLTTYAQLWAADPAANALGLVGSNAVLHGWRAPWVSLPVGRVYMPGSPASGIAEAGGGLVTRFDL